MTLVVRRIRPGEGESLRRLRLAALADSPEAFASTHEAEAALPASEWAHKAATRSTGYEHATFVAEVEVEAEAEINGNGVGDGEIDGEWVGMVGGLRNDREPGLVELVAMFTAPASRGTGAGGALVDAVVDWARAGGAECVSLWVVRTNEPARRLYERCGFSVTASPPDSDSPCRDEVRMTRQLSLATPNHHRRPGSIGTNR